MPRGEKQKLKLLCLLDLLKQETDAEHPMSVAEIIERLADCGISAERKSIYDDVRALCDYGVCVEAAPRRGYYIEQRTYELAELKMLVDIICSAKFLTEKKSRELIHKLYAETSRYGAAALDRQVYAAHVKSQSEVIYYTVDAIHAAIREGVQISFRYYHYDASKARVERKDGYRYAVSPWTLVWNDENYYLVAYDDAEQSIRHFRVDRMGDVRALKRARCGKEAFEHFDLAAYESKTFGMFGGREETVTLACAERAADAIIDRFGVEPTFIRRADGGFDVTVRVFTSPQFYGWLLGLSGLVRLKAPTRAVDDYRAYLKQAVEDL